MLRPQKFISLLKPVHVKCPGLQFLRRQGRVPGDHGLLAVVEPLVHMGHKIIAAALHPLPPQMLLDDIDPLGRVHGHLHQPPLPDAGAFQPPGQVRRRLVLPGIAVFQQASQIFLLSQNPRAAKPPVIGLPSQGVAAQGHQNPHQIVHAAYVGNPVNAVGKLRLAVTPAQLHIHDAPHQAVVDRLTERALLRVVPHVSAALFLHLLVERLPQQFHRSPVILRPQAVSLHKLAQRVKAVRDVQILHHRLAQNVHGHKPQTAGLQEPEKADRRHGFPVLPQKPPHAPLLSAFQFKPAGRLERLGKLLVRFPVFQPLEIAV